MNSQLVITALIDNFAALSDLIKLVQDCRCNILESRMNTLGGEYAVFILVRGNWDGIVKIESALSSLVKKNGLNVISKRTEDHNYEENLLPYLVQIVGLDKPGMAHSVLQFFIDQEIEIHKFEAKNFATAPTNTLLGSFTLTVLVPATLQIAELRENFIVFCDDLNIDAILEPAKYTADE